MNIHALLGRLVDAAAVQVVPVLCAVAVDELQRLDVHRVSEVCAKQRAGTRACGHDIGAERRDIGIRVIGSHLAPLVLVLQDIGALGSCLGVGQADGRAHELIAAAYYLPTPWQ